MRWGASWVGSRVSSLPVVQMDEFWLSPHPALSGCMFVDTVSVAHYYHCGLGLQQMNFRGTSVHNL